MPPRDPQKRPPVTVEEIRACGPAVPLTVANRALDISHTKGYVLARQGLYPVRLLKIGSTYRVPTYELLRALGIEPITNEGSAA